LHPGAGEAAAPQADAAVLLQAAPCLIGVEACGTAHHWARMLAAMGHEVGLIAHSYMKACS